MDVQMVGDHRLEFNSFEELIKIVPKKLNFKFDSQYLTHYLSELNISKGEKQWSYLWELKFDSYYKSIEEQFEVENEINFKGPFGHSLNIGNKSFALYSPVRWSAFLTDVKIREELRVFVFYILKSLDGNIITYFPDNGGICSEYEQYISHSMTLNDILQLMQE